MSKKWFFSLFFMVTISGMVNAKSVREYFNQNICSDLQCVQKQFTDVCKLCMRMDDKAACLEQVAFHYLETYEGDTVAQNMAEQAIKKADSPQSYFDLAQWYCRNLSDTVSFQKSIKYFKLANIPSDSVFKIIEKILKPLITLTKYNTKCCSRHSLSNRIS